MISGGYYLKARQIVKSAINKTVPCTREVWDYLLREANFADSKQLKKGQLKKSYQQMINDLSWKVGARHHEFSQDQIKRAMIFLRNHKMILSQRVTRGVLITVCNYEYFQDKTNYERLDTNSENPYKIKYLELRKNYERLETTLERLKKTPTERLTERLSPNPEDKGAQSNTERIHPIESLTERLTERLEIPPTIDNIHQCNSIEYYINIYNKNYPCQNDEEEFERDRRIFFHAFDGLKTFQLFDDSPDNKNSELIKVFHVDGSMPVKYIMRLEELNNQGAGIYLCINECSGKTKNRKSSDIVKVRSVFADFDEVPLPDKFDEEPSMIVESSHGKYHVYYFTDDTPLNGFKQIQKGMIYKYKSDDKIHDLPRVLRIPGFNHMKGEPFMTRILSYTGLKYSFGLLNEMFPPEPVKQWSAPKYQKPINGNDGEFKGSRGASEPGRNCHIIKCLGGAKKRGLSWQDIEREAYLEGEACFPPLPQSEIKDILKSFRRY